MGIESVKKQASTKVLIVGLGALGIEIAKNITLAGCKELLIADETVCSEDDLSGQFFVTKKDIQ